MAASGPDLVVLVNPNSPTGQHIVADEIETLLTAATRALGSLEYYQAWWAETHVLRGELSAGLRELGWDVVPGCANFLLAHLPEDGPSAAEVLAHGRRCWLHLREATSMGGAVGDRAVRIAVKDAETNRRMLATLSDAQ